VYSTDDAAALRDWVTNKGGAIIAMSGYGSNPSEVQPVNTLLTPFGITYDADSTYTSNDYPSTSTCGPLCYCADGSIPFDNWNSLFPDITRNLGNVGVSMGRSITCPGSDCQVVATNNVDTAAQSNIAGVAKVVGKGRVFPGATSGRPTPANGVCRRILCMTMPPPRLSVLATPR
jgi:hypothetical protein